MHANYLILEAENKLNNFIPHYPTRNKRGLVNIIVKASKWLFGTLDSGDGEKYDKAIKTFLGNQNSTADEYFTGQTHHV